MSQAGPLRSLPAQEFLAVWRDGDWALQNPAEPGMPPGVSAAVSGIIERVRAGGQQALLELTSLYDGAVLKRLEVDQAELARAASSVPAGLSEALVLAAQRIRDFALRARSSLLGEAGLRDGSLTAPGDGPCITEVWCPLERVGVYAPGGRAPYASSVLMAAIPARVAGVGELVLCTPPGAGGAVPPAIAAAALLAGVDRVFLLGGVQAVAAMAFGAGEVPRVDKIAGPGGLWVTEAKRQLFGTVGLDGLAGPSEVVAVSSYPPAAPFIAWQLVAQAEHDPQALALAVIVPPLSPGNVLEEVRRCLDELPGPCRRTAVAALSSRGAVIAARDGEEAAAVVEAVRPEHLWVDLGGRRESVEFARRAMMYAGAVFIGPCSPVALGDYVAGPSHVLPTGGTARWASPLGVVDFMRRVSWVEVGDYALAPGPAPGSAPGRGRGLVPAAATIARHEGFHGHAASLDAMGYRGSGPARRGETANAETEVQPVVKLDR